MDLIHVDPDVIVILPFHVMIILMEHIRLELLLEEDPFLKKLELHQNQNGLHVADLVIREGIMQYILS